jgi:hypothetical protein
MTALESWRYRDPARVYERIERQEQAKDAQSVRAKQKWAKQEIEKLFKEAPIDGVDNR